jgi:hypothetical protein
VERPNEVGSLVGPDRRRYLRRSQLPEPEALGAEPRALVTVWLAAAVGFGLLLVVAEGARGPLDDTDPAQQRPGILDLGALPRPAPRVTPDIPAPGRRAVVLLERPGRLERLCRALQEDPFPKDVDVAVVTPAEGGVCPSDAAVVVDPTAALARRFGLSSPRGGGTPVGYAVVDSRQRIRYRTLDPHVANRLDEVATIVEAVP